MCWRSRLQTARTLAISCRGPVPQPFLDYQAPHATSQLLHPRRYVCQTHSRSSRAWCLAPRDTESGNRKCKSEPNYNNVSALCWPLIDNVWAFSNNWKKKLLVKKSAQRLQTTKSASNTTNTQYLAVVFALQRCEKSLSVYFQTPFIRCRIEHKQRW